MKELDLKDRTLNKILRINLETKRDKPYFQYMEKEPITFEKTEEMASKIANALSHLGVKRGNNVVLMLTNCPQFIYLWLGLSKIGAVTVPINIAYKGDLLQHVLNNSEAQVFVMEEEFLDRLKAIQDNLVHLKKVVIFSEKEWPEDRGYRSHLKFECLPYEELEKFPPINHEEDMIHYDPSLIVYTSGTTGPSKGVVLPYNYVYNFVRNFINSLRLRPGDVVYNDLPTFHISGLFMNLIPMFLEDSRMILYKRFSLANFWENIRKHKATVFIAMGSSLVLLSKQPRSPDDGDNPVRVAVGAPIPAEIHEEFEKRFNLKLIQPYGATESGGLCMYIPYDAPRPGSCGKPLERYDVRIFDDNDNELPPNQIGEIVVRSKEPFITMLGYYNMPEKTLETYQNLWYHSGDLGYSDEDGYFYFMGRKKDALRRRGENISAYEVEKVVDSHPLVLESAAVAVPSELTEDEIKIVVVLKEGQGLTPEELISYCEDRMAYFMIPRYVEFKESLPKTPTLRVEKYKLRQEGITENTWDREKAGYKLKK